MPITNGVLGNLALSCVVLRVLRGRCLHRTVVTRGRGLPFRTVRGVPVSDTGHSRKSAQPRSYMACIPQGYVVAVTLLLSRG